MAIPLRGVSADSQYLASVLDGLPGDLVLVGHSYGGMLIAIAATGNDRVKALVLVGAFAPEAGESAADLTGRYEGSTLGETLNAVALPDGGTDLYIAQDRYHAQFAADVSVRVAERMAATQRPISAAALAEASGTPTEIAAGHPSTISFADVPAVPDDLAGIRRVVDELGRTTVGTDALQDSLFDLLAWAAHHDVALEDLDARSPSLETVFLSIADGRDPADRHAQDTPLHAEGAP